MAAFLHGFPGLRDQVCNEPTLHGARSGAGALAKQERISPLI